MAKKRFKPEQIMARLRQIEVGIANGKATPQACKDAEITEQLRDECLNGELCYSLQEAQIVIEQWRVQYNTQRPHSPLGYRPPAPVAYRPGIYANPLSQPLAVI